MRCTPIVITAFAALLWSSAPARAESGNGFGLGLIVGQPTGITAGFGLSDNTMIDAALGLDWINDRDLYVHVEFDYYLPTLIKGSSVDLNAYLGIGGFVVNHKDVGIGARAPFGLSLDFASVPLQIFGEAVLLVPLIPDVDLSVRGAVGFRYWF
jgi:hypothetical protein